MPDVLRFTVHGPPVAKERARVVNIGGHARSFTPAKTMAYEKLVGDLCRVAARAAGWHLDGEAYGVELHVHFADRRRRDIDNVAKAILDGMNGTAYQDDSRVSELHIYKNIDRAKPRVEVRIWRASVPETAP